MSEPNSTQGVLPAPEDPSYIKYLLNPQLKYKCHFLVGNEALNITVERIGVVKKMLFAHSNILRIAVEDSPIAEKDNVPVTDLYPDTFRNVLRYVYGYDNTASLAFTDADNLLYAAEKYNILPLKGKVCSRLMALLTYDNICGLLNNPACFQALELNAAITQILQCETDKVLSSSQFLELSSSAFLHIVQQERLQVPEIELWRSAIRWAKNRVGSEDGASLRAELSDHVKHIRFCSLSSEEFCFEVVTSRVLTGEELAVVSESLKTKQVQPELKQICNNVEPRVGSDDGASLRAELTDHVKHIRVCSLSLEEFCFEVVTSRVLTGEEHAVVSESLKTKQVQPELKQICNNVEPRRKLMLYTPSEPLTAEMYQIGGYCPTRTSQATITTKEHIVELMSLRCCWTEQDSVQGTVTIKGPFMNENGSKTETEITVDFNKQGVTDSQYDVALENNKICVQLLPGSEFLVQITYKGCIYAHIMQKQDHTFTHFNVSVGVEHDRYICHFANIQYKTLM